MRAVRGIEAMTVARVALFAGLFLIFAFTDDRFATKNNIFTIFEGFAFVGLAALAVGVTIIAGQLDLSVGSAAAVAGIIAIKIIDVGLIPALLITTVLGVAYGAVQGWLIHRLRIESLVFTLGTLIALRGVAFVLSGENTVVLADLEIANSVKRQLFIFSPFSIVTIAVFVAMGIFLVYTRYGREIYAIGGGRHEATAAGVPAVRPLVLAFALSGGLAALTGALTSIKSSSATPGGFETLLLPAVTAALIGGVSLLGGRGTVIGIAMGALALRFLNSGLSLRGAPFYVLTFATGAMLMAIVVLELLVGRPELRARIARWRARRQVEALGAGT